MDKSSEPPRPATDAAPRVENPISVVATSAQLARFEFADGGTKILMVEWHPDASAPADGPSDNSTIATADSGADADVDASTISASVETNTSVDLKVNIEADQPPSSKTQPTSSPGTSARTSDTEADADAWQVSWPGKSTFLPARDADQDGTRRRVYFLLPPEVPVPGTVNITPPGRPSIVVKPLPAIFPKSVEAEAGTRGVLHTIWAKRRLLELDREMDAEMRANAESVGLQMVLAEKNWIIDNFLSSPQAPEVTEAPPLSPRSPVGGRLGEKLKGLRLATSPADLTRTPVANVFMETDVPAQTLSPDGTDIAVSSFPAISSRSTAPVSLDAAINGTAIPGMLDGHDTDDDLFALPISPRSPDMKKSPFSFLRTG